MKRQFIDENKDLIQKEKKLKKSKKISSILKVVLLVVALILAFEGYMGKRSSWFFNDVLHISIKENEIPTQNTAIIEEDTSSIFELNNQVDDGSTNYIFKLSSNNWTILETGKIVENDILNVDISSYLGVGCTEVTLVTEFYGSFGNLLESSEQKFTITK